MFMYNIVAKCFGESSALAYSQVESHFHTSCNIFGRKRVNDQRIGHNTAQDFVGRNHNAARSSGLSDRFIERA